MDGNATAEASITPQWLPDSPKTGAPCGNRRTSAGGHFLRNHSLFEFVNAERLSDLIVSLLPRVLRQCALASLGQNRSIYQFAMDRIVLMFYFYEFNGFLVCHHVFPPRDGPGRMTERWSVSRDAESTLCLINNTFTSFVRLPHEPHSAKTTSVTTE